MGLWINVSKIKKLEEYFLKIKGENPEELLALGEDGVREKISERVLQNNEQLKEAKSRNDLSYVLYYQNNEVHLNLTE